MDLSGVLEVADGPAPEGVATPLGLRGCAPHELRARLASLLGDLGITRVANLTGMDRVGVPVHVAVRPQARTLSAAAGKGATPDASWVSAVMEGAEHAAWERLGDAELDASESTLSRLGVPALSGATLPLRVGALWSEHLSVRWRAGFDVLRGEEVMVPDALVAPEVVGPSPFAGGSNGLASGIHVAEATLAGLLEVIERDGMALHRCTGEGSPVDAGPLLELAAPQLAEQLRAACLDAEVFDLTTELGVPTFQCHLRGEDAEGLGTFLGAGAALDDATALVRAVVEAVQSRTVVVAGARDDLFTSTRRASLTARPRPGRERARPLEARVPIGDPAAQTVTGALEHLVARLAECGFDRVVVLRHSSPGDPVQVVRVVVPGLEGHPSLGTWFGPRARARAARARKGRR